MRELLLQLIERLVRRSESLTTALCAHSTEHPQMRIKSNAYMYESKSLSAGRKLEIRLRWAGDCLCDNVCQPFIDTSHSIHAVTMQQPEEQIFRLNKRIKELIAIYEKSEYSTSAATLSFCSPPPPSNNANISEPALSQNVQLDGENERLRAALAHSDEQLKRVHQLNVQYKHDLDKLIVDRDQQQRIQHGLKTKLNETMSMCRDQNDEIGTLKRSLQAQRAISMAPGRGQPPTAITSIVPDKELEEECTRLRADVKQLEDELQESYELIDDLEFEVEQVMEEENGDDSLEIIKHLLTIDRISGIGKRATGRGAEHSTSVDRNCGC